MLRSQGVPPDQIDMVIGMMEKDPALFQKIATEIQEKIKGGMNQEQAALAVMGKYQDDLKKLV